MSNTKHQIEDCLLDLANWMSQNTFKLNQDKTELLIFHSKFRRQPTFPSLNVGTDVITPSDSAKNIGVIFDRTMSMSSHIN